jgi:Tfp pilus assembly protein PilV
MNAPKATSGFTMTELLISVVVMMFGVLGFVSAMAVSTTELWYGARDTEVAMLAADQLERVRALPYDSVRSGERVAGDYRLEWNVQGADPKRLTLSVTFANRQGVPGADTLVAFVPR